MSRVTLPRRTESDTLRISASMPSSRAASRRRAAVRLAPEKTSLPSERESQVRHTVTSQRRHSARITARFTEIRQDIEAVCYGSYFLEVMDYVTRENNDESQMLLLLYQSLRALQAENIPNRLVRSVFEIKTAALEGEYFPPGPEDGFLEASLYAMRFIVENPPARLYTFRVSEEVLDQLEQAGHVLMQRLTGHTFSSLEMLELLRGPMA